jgi:MerR family transcriptional regulator, redox-sensitive transcriptional activator SoxR
VTALSIGEVARRTGLRTSALRYYEETGLLPAPARANGRRVYDHQVIRRIDGLRFAQEAGFSLKEIKLLFQGLGAKSTLSARWQSMARKKMLELDVLATRVERMRHALELGLKCGCVRIEDCTLSPADVPQVEPQRRKSNGGCAC